MYIYFSHYKLQNKNEYQLAWVISTKRNDIFIFFNNVVHDHMEWNMQPIEKVHYHTPRWLNFNMGMRSRFGLEFEACWLLHNILALLIRHSLPLSRGCHWVKDTAKSFLISKKYLYLLSKFERTFVVKVIKSILQKCDDCPILGSLHYPLITLMISKG